MAKPKRNSVALSRTRNGQMGMGRSLRKVELKVERMERPSTAEFEESDQSAQFKSGQIVRYDKTFSTEVAQVDGLPNFVHITRSSLPTMALLEKGINTLSPASTLEGERKPAILIGSSPHKTGTDQTPWHDIFEP